MDIERMHEMIEKLSESVKCEFDKGIENVDTCEMSSAVDMLKDLSEAMYYRTLTVAMQESDAEEIMDMFDRYGDDRRFYNRYHYKNGKFASKGSGTRRGYDEPMYHMPLEMYRDYTPEKLRDMDRMSGRLYYTEVRDNREKLGEHKENIRESKYDRAKRMYTETKDMHKANTPEDKQITLKEGEKFLNVLFDELDEMLQDATPEMKNMIKTKTMARMQKIN